MVRQRWHVLGSTPFSLVRPADSGESTLIPAPAGYAEKSVVPQPQRRCADRDRTSSPQAAPAASTTTGRPTREHGLGKNGPKRNRKKNRKGTEKENEKSAENVGARQKKGAVQGLAKGAGEDVKLLLD